MSYLRRILLSLLLTATVLATVLAGDLTAARADVPLPNFDRLQPSADPVRLTSSPRPLNVSYTHNGKTHTLQDYLHRTAQGLVVLDGTQVVKEWYAPGYSADSVFQSWSIAKGFTAHAIGIAISEGKIGSLDDPVATYVPELARHAYGPVTIRNLLRMTSGIKWDGQLDDISLQVVLSMGWTTTLKYAAAQTSAVPQGTTYNYNSMNSAVLALVLARATGRPYHQYVQDKIWGPAGMASTAFVGNDSHGNAMGYCCYYARDRDFARWGLTLLRGGQANGRQVIPASWLAYASTPNPLQPDHDVTGGVLDGSDGYWYGGFGGQIVYVSTRHRVVIVKTTLYSVHEDETLPAMRATAAEVAATR
ncbi:serine hydrolase [Actinomadura fulvescens]|uniref:Beta-lactamase-related domain-containing protein n=1 Tax=Actinomadura fulvescens TaxID=46160 RepID=A0ABP6CDV3_9ACTN